MSKKSISYKITTFIILGCFLAQGILPSYSYGLTFNSLPAPTQFITLTQKTFHPASLRGLRFYPENPLRFDFIIDEGERSLSSQELKEQSSKLIRHFLASLTIPEEDLWVNLSPLEKDKVMPSELGLTQMGMGLLGQDYILKQLIGSLTYPESPQGKEFWSRVYQKAAQLFGTSKIPINTYNKIWIIPDSAEIYEDSDRALLGNARLKVMLEEDYLLLKENFNNKESKKFKLKEDDFKEINSFSSRIMKEVVLPEIEKEVNEGKNFEELRQIYHCLILASWFKRKLKSSILNSAYINQKKTKGVDNDEPDLKEKIYNLYLQAYKQGLYNYTRSDTDPATRKPVRRRYYSGGFDARNVLAIVDKRPLNQDPDTLANVADPTPLTPLHKATWKADPITTRSPSGQPASGAGAASPLTATLEDNPAKPYDGNGIGLSLSNRDILERVIIPVSENLPDGVSVKTDTDGSLLISHEQPVNGRKITLSYRIILEGSTISVSRIPSLQETNVIRLPALPWTDVIVNAAQNAWRRITIHDPLLNRRFAATKIELAPYQLEAVEHILSTLADGHDSLSVMATGTGKTLVAFTAMHRYLEKLKSSGKRPGPVLFLVNNKVILEQAENNLHLYYPGEYKTGRIYGGDKSAEAEAYNGNSDVIFATPASLSGKRLETLLNSRGSVAAVIVDEVHHLPASTHKMIHSHLKAHNSDIPFIGFTATEIRPDRASVIGFFDRIFDFHITDAWQLGYLVPPEYLAGDGDIEDIIKDSGIDVNKAGIWEKGSPADVVYRKWRYHNDRFPFLLEQYRRSVEGRPDDRGLILAPNIERARAFVSYLSSEGVAAVSLTSEDRDNNPEWFQHVTEAWKTGRWPQGSPYSSQPVPKLVVAVKIFSEGADIPAINTVILWSDTNSSIQFIQSIGRGLRPAPLKTHLTIIDAVGLYHKVGIMRYLISLARGESEFQKPQDRDGKAKSASGDNSSERLRDLTNFMVIDPGIGEKIKAFLDDVPTQMEMRYGKYSNIPSGQMARLDEFIARRLGIDLLDRDALANYIRNLVNQLREASSNGQINHEKIEGLHDSLLPVFYVTDIFDASDNVREIPLHATTLIVFGRLTALMGQVDPELKEDDFYRLFPEFHPERRKIERWRTENLKILRGTVFGLGEGQMTEELIRDHLESHSGVFDLADEIGELLSGEQEQLNSKDRVLLMRYAEGGRDDLRGDATDHSSYESATAIYEVGNRIGWNQRGLIAAYLSHSRLKGKNLDYDSFNVSPDQFMAKLAELGFFESPLTREQFIDFLYERIKDYSAAVNSNDKEKIIQYAEGVLQVLQDTKWLAPPGENESVDYSESIRDVQTSWYIFENISDVSETEAIELPAQHQDIARRLEELLSSWHIRKVFQSEELPAVKIVAERTTGDRDSQWNFVIEGLPGREQPEMSVVLRDFLGRTHVFLKTSESSRNVQELESAYQNLDMTQQEIFVKEMIRAISFSVEDVSRPEEAVYIVPVNESLRGLMVSSKAGRLQFALESESGNLFSDLLESIRGMGGYVLGPIAEVTEKDAFRAMRPAIEAFERSVLPLITDLNSFRRSVRFGPAEDMRDIGKVKNPMPSYINRLANLYALMHVERNGEGRQAVFEKLRSFKANNKAEQRIVSALESNFRWLLVMYDTGDYNFLTDNIKQALELLDADHPEHSLSADRIHLASIFIGSIFSGNDNGKGAMLRRFAMPFGDVLRKYLVVTRLQGERGTPETESEIKQFLNEAAEIAPHIFDFDKEADYEKVGMLIAKWSPRLFQLKEKLSLEQKQQPEQKKKEVISGTGPSQKIDPPNVAASVPEKNKNVGPPELSASEKLEEQAAVANLRDAVSDPVKREIMINHLMSNGFSRPVIITVLRRAEEEWFDDLSVLASIKRFEDKDALNEFRKALAGTPAESRSSSPIQEEFSSSPLGQDAARLQGESSSPVVSEAPDKVGGIDLNPASLTLDVKQNSQANKNQESLPQKQQVMAFDIQNFQGFTFQIIKIEPVRDLVGLVRR